MSICHAYISPATAGFTHTDSRIYCFTDIKRGQNEELHLYTTEDLGIGNGTGLAIRARIGFLGGGLSQNCLGRFFASAYPRLPESKPEETRGFCRLRRSGLGVGRG